MMLTGVLLFVSEALAMDEPGLVLKRQLLRKRKQILDKFFTQSEVTEPWPTGDW